MLDAVENLEACCATCFILPPASSIVIVDIQSRVKVLA
jgi:hypothetical protein